MPAVQSKAAHLKTLSLASAANVFAWLMMIPARPEMVLRVCNGDAQRAATVLASLTTGASLFEFIATPLLGRLSDKYGRRPFLIAAPVVCCLARLVTFFAGDGNLSAVVAANWVDRCFSGSAFPLFLTVARASITDLVLGEELTKAMTGLAAAAGLAVSISPFAGAIIMKKTGNPKYVALAAALVSAYHAYYVWKHVDETLEPSKRKAVDPEACNPFSFLRFWRDAGVEGKHMRLLSWIVLLLSIPSEMHDTRMVMLKTNLGFETTDIAKYMLAVGASIMLSGVAAKKSISALGTVAHTHLAVASAVGALAAYAGAKNGRHVALACACSVLGGTCSAGVKTMLTTLAVRQGMGRGQIAASLANMTTLSKVVAPLVFAKLFGRFGQRAPFYTAAMFLLAAEVLFSSGEGTRAAKATMALEKKMTEEKEEEPAKKLD